MSDPPTEVKKEFLSKGLAKTRVSNCGRHCKHAAVLATQQFDPSP